jgi:hypothetical protein
MFHFDDLPPKIVKPYSVDTWYHITLSTVSHVIKTSLEIKINSHTLAKVSSGYLYFSQLGNMILGSHYSANFFSGYIYGWAYYPHAFTWRDYDENFCFGGGFCLSNCKYSEYEDA